MNVNEVFTKNVSMRGLNMNKMVSLVNKAMQANKDLSDTEMHQAFVVNANSSGGFTFGEDDRPERIIKAFFATTAAFLGKNKIAKVDEAVALVLCDLSGGFRFAGIVEYHENNDNPDEPGNWSLVFTFNEQDLEDLEKTKTVKKMLYSSVEFRTLFDKIAYDICSIQFEHDSYLYDACLITIDTLTQVLDREGQFEGETVDVELPGFFVASVAVEDGEKVMGIVPDGALKAIIKDDSALEKLETA